MVVFFEHVHCRISRDEGGVAVVVFEEPVLAGFDGTTPLAVSLHRQKPEIGAKGFHRHGSPPENHSVPDPAFSRFRKEFARAGFEVIGEILAP